MDTFLVPAMMGVFMAHNHDYPFDKSRDYPALRSIAQFIHNKQKLSGNIEHNSPAILEIFEILCKTIMSDNFYCQKSLSTISNHIQEISLKTAYGDRSKKGAPLNTATIREKLANRYSN